MKKCSQCGETKPLEAFYRDSTRPDGYMYQCKVCSRAIHRSWRKGHPEEVRAISRRWREAHPEEVQSNSHEWYVAHSEEARANTREWCKGHPERTRAHSRKRRVLLRGATHKPYDEYTIYARDQGICWLCGRSVDVGEFAIDHFVPVSKGGPDIPENVRIVHPWCNSAKHNRMPTHEEAQTWLTVINAPSETIRKEV